MKTRELTISAIFVVLIAICAQLTIPTPIIPFTLQVFAVALTGLCLNKKQILLTISVYILVGLMGLPVFSNGQAGIAMILKPSFGFIIGFIPMAMLIKKQPIIAWLSLYLIALPFLYLNMKYLLQIDTSIISVLKLYFLTFIPTDLISIVGAFYVFKRIGNTYLYAKDLN